MRWERRATGSAAIILDDEKRVLLMRRAYPPHDWVLPGGNAEAHESPVDTVVREVAEETGIDVVPQRLTGVYYQPDHRAGEFLHFVFRCVTAAPVALTLDPTEVAAAGWFAPDALPEPMSLSTRQRVRDGCSEVSLPLPMVLPPRAES